MKTIRDFGLRYYQKFIAYDVTAKISFEKKVWIVSSHKSIAGNISDTKVLIEQKSINVDLRKPQKQSDGVMLTPYQQAKRYRDNLPLKE